MVKIISVSLLFCHSTYVTLQGKKFLSPFKTGVSEDDRLKDFIRIYSSVILLSPDLNFIIKSMGDNG